MEAWRAFSFNAWRQQRPTHANAHAVAVYGSYALLPARPPDGEPDSVSTLRLTVSESSAPYVDSIASVITDRYPAKDGLISVPVYWVFDRSDVERVDPAALALVVRSFQARLPGDGRRREKAIRVLVTYISRLDSTRPPSSRGSTKLLVGPRSHATWAMATSTSSCCAIAGMSSSIR
jgi:hypothetical protein